MQRMKAQLYRLWRTAFFESVIGSLRIGSGSLFSDNQIKKVFFKFAGSGIYDRVHRASSWDQEGPDIATAPGPPPMARNTSWVLANNVMPTIVYQGLQPSSHPVLMSESDQLISRSPR
ncbi:uncharacterized protein LOC113565655 [Drosophila persimilis]|uniref:uncharacterized protein LOC113565655 n=1 Tax=Drosophila persimilis TaxID=7234 RepID=UPI000F088B62|nr:uncharacterized protein LOC113565655 [Drosophila persimilis]